jgi:hypothetical protein
MSETFLPKPVFAKLTEIESANLESAEASDKAYYHEHLTGDAAPKEALRVRTELASVLQMLVDNRDHSSDDGTFSQKLKSLEADFEFMIKRTARALDKIQSE